MSGKHESFRCPASVLAFLAAAAAIALALVAGCTSDEPAASGTARPGSIVEIPRSGPASLSTIRSELLDTKAQLRVTMDALHVLQASSLRSAPANYKSFTEAYDHLKTRSDAMAARVVDLKEQTASYYAGWTYEVGLVDPELRQAALQRQATAERIYDTINTELELTRHLFPPLNARLNEIRIYLRGNLVPARLYAMSGEVAKADAEAEEVDAHAATILAAIDEIAAATGKKVVPTNEASPAR